MCEGPCYESGSSDLILNGSMMVFMDAAKTEQEKPEG